MKNNRGVTLVELLTVLALLSMITILGSTVHIFAQRQFNTQTKVIENQADVRLVLNLIKKEIRSAESVEVANDILTINDSDVYHLENHQLKKNNRSFVSNLGAFNIEKEGRRVTMEIQGLPVANGQIISRSATIYLRE